MRKLTLSTLLAILMMAFACKDKQKQDKTLEVNSKEVITPKKTPRLDLVWETDTLLTTCEAVLYHKALDVIFVANVNNNPWKQDNNGFISTIDTKGKILEAKWIEGLSGPKGMGVFDGKLYVNDINRIVEIDIEAQKISHTYTIDGEPQLNDITVGPKGTVYASGSNSNSVYVLKNGDIQDITLNSEGRLNGLSYQKDKLFFIDSGKHNFGSYDFESGTSKIYTEAIGHGDGIVRLETGDFVVSDWKGRVFHINASTWEKTLLLDTRDENINAADIDYISETQMLLVPTFFNNSVMCYKLNL